MKYIYSNPPPSTSSNIPELAADPVSPAVNDVWVLRTTIANGTPIGLLLALTHTITDYKFSYKTIAGQIVRVKLS